MLSNAGAGPSRDSLPGLVGERVRARALDGTFRRSNSWWLSGYLLAIGSVVEIGSWVSPHPPRLWTWIWTIAFGLVLVWSLAAVLLDGYRFNETTFSVYTLARLRVRRFAWPEVRYFEVRGYRHGAGLRLRDGRWVRLRPATFPYREKSELEISRLDLARQIRTSG